MQQLKSHFIASTLSALLVLLNGLPVTAALTVQTNKVGSTPELIGYNSGHFYPGSNTRDWWRYSGVSGARFFVSANEIEWASSGAADKLPPWGDGVTNQTSFTNRQALLRNDPLNTSYINWSYLTSRFHNNVLSGANLFVIDSSFSALRQLGVQILVNITASESQLPITSSTDWAGKWELWHRYYEAAFYLGREFDVQRYQMFNEPDGNASLTTADYLPRLQLASDAIQAALADVNRNYGKSLTPLILAPVTAGTAANSYAGWGAVCVTNRHLNFLSLTSTNWLNLQKYDYHEYGSTPADYGANLASLRSTLTSKMAPESPFPVTISEFNTHTGANFDSTSATLDSTSEYPTLGAMAVNLVKNLINEMYCFKFSQTINQSTTATNYPVAKNGMHFVDNTNAPYNIGGITKAGEVWRLFTKACAPGRDRLNFTTDTASSGLDVQATYDPATKRYYIFAVNDSSSSATWTANFSAWSIPATNQILVEEVSQSCYGAGKFWTNLGAARTFTGTQGANTAWLFTVPSNPQQPMQTVVATGDATVKDGANSGLNFGSDPTLQVANNSTNANNRSAGLVKFHMPPASLSNLELAALSFRASSINGGSTVQAHVYGITNSSWSQGAVTWATAPNLGQSIAPGVDFINNYVFGIGDFVNAAVPAANSAQLVGQLVAGSTAAERMIDVTDFLRRNASPDSDISFLVAREVRFYGDAQDTDGVSIVSTEGDASNSPRLKLSFAVIPSPPGITAITNGGNGSVTINFSGSANQTFYVQATTNLSSAGWLNVSTNVSDAGGHSSFTDSGLTNFPQRFYRAANQ